MLWTPVESEIKQIKFAYKEFLGGKSVRAVAMGLISSGIASGDTETKITVLIHKWTRILRRFGNTGYALATDGLEILKKFERCETGSIRELMSEAYYVKSLKYPVQIIPIADWTAATEKLQNYKKVLKGQRRRTDTETATGIITCPHCGLRYYICKNKKYSYYRHWPNGKCKQHPKNFNIKKINTIFEVWYFYRHLLFDNTKALMEANKERVKLELAGIKDKMNLPAACAKLDPQFSVTML
jgi:hypothetical protein